MSISQRVSRLREELGMSQQVLAEQSGITQATISRLESGHVEQLKSRALARLADALHVTMDYLAGRTADVTTDGLLQSDPDAAGLMEAYRRLTPENRRRLMEYAWFLRFSERMSLEQLGHLEHLMTESTDLTGVDRQIAILRALAEVGGGTG